tara:strand:- start:452 stop:796 length:345 start_codon:yes stop_codon:yes gene_type:complete
MKAINLARRFENLNLNGSDLSVKVRRDSPNCRRVTSVSISGRLVKPMNNYVDAHFDFYILIDPATDSVGLCVETYEINHERKDCTVGRQIQFHDSVDDFRQAEAIANTLESLAA